MFHRTFRQTTWEMGRNTVPIWMTASLKYLLITVKVVALAKVSLLISKILRLFVNTLTADGKHYLLNRDNLTQPIQMQLSQNQKSFSGFFFAFLWSIFNFKHFPKKMIALIADIFTELPVPKNMIRPISKKSCFRRPFERQHGKWVETLLQSERHYLYNIY